MGACCSNRQQPNVVLNSKNSHLTKNNNFINNNYYSNPNEEEELNKAEPEKKQQLVALSSNQHITSINNTNQNKDIVNSIVDSDVNKAINNAEEQKKKTPHSPMKDRKNFKKDNATIINPALLANLKNQESSDVIAEQSLEYSKSKSIKNYHKVATISHNKKDFNVKAKIERNDKTIQDKYNVLNQLGKGSFGTVFKVFHKHTKQTRAMKVIKKENIFLQDDEQKFLKEIEILKELDHMNVIKIYEYYEDSMNYYLITEFVSGGELYDTIIKWNFFDENVARGIFKQIISAVAYIHNLNIIHRDLKPENILVESMKGDMINIKLIDFGTCNYFQKDKKLRLQVGSPYYIAPEVLDGSYNEKCDIWSCGCILYVLLVGYPPFEALTSEELLKRVKLGKYDTEGEGWDCVSDEAKDLVKKMLCKNFKKRISANEILNHPWLKQKIEVKTKDMKSVLSNIKNFHEQDRLQQATINYIVHFLTPPSELEQMKGAFRDLDVNGDGTLSKEELRAGFEKLFGQVGKADELEKVLEEIDSDNNGSISYEEFLSAVMNRNKLFNEENLKLCFESFDKNGDNKLSAEEIRKALGAKDNEYVKELISLIDENGNNEIDFEEFKELMNLLLTKEKGGTFVNTKVNLKKK